MLYQSGQLNPENGRPCGSAGGRRRITLHSFSASGLILRFEAPVLDVLVDRDGDPGVEPADGLVEEVDDHQVGRLAGGDRGLDLVVDGLQAFGEVDLDARSRR